MFFLGVAGEDFGGFEVLDGDLAIEAEAADGLDVFVEKFDPDRLGLLPGIDVENAAAAGELAAGENFWNGFVAGLGEGGFEIGDGVALVDFEREGVAAEGVGCRDGEIELVGGDDEAEGGSVGELAEDVEALGEDLRDRRCLRCR